MHTITDGGDCMDRSLGSGHDLVAVVTQARLSQAWVASIRATDGDQDSSVSSKLGVKRARPQ